LKAVTGSVFSAIHKDVFTEEAKKAIEISASGRPMPILSDA